MVLGNVSTNKKAQCYRFYMTDLIIPHWHSSADGLSLFYRRINGPQTSVPLVCLHDLGETGAVFESLAPFISDSHTLIAPDLRGAGNSDYALDLASYQIDNLVLDFSRLLHAERLRRFVLFGRGMGGHLALKISAEWPERIAGLALWETNPNTAAHMAKWQSAPSHEWDNAALPQLIEAFTQANPWGWLDAVRERPLLYLYTEHSGIVPEATLAQLGQTKPNFQRLQISTATDADAFTSQEAISALRAFVAACA